MVTWKSLEMACRVSISGTVSPCSQRDTACRVTKSFSAMPFWERPAFFRKSVKMSLNFMGPPPLQYQLTMEGRGRQATVGCSYRRKRILPVK